MLTTEELSKESEQYQLGYMRGVVDSIEKIIVNK